MAWVSFFAITFGLVEAVVVVYLRGLYYPEGFVFPLKMIPQSHLLAELAREFATMVMLISVGAIAGISRWQKFSYFMIAFGIWDIFYYVWLKVFLDWPLSLADWDILFLIPIPWIGPVIAPVLISVLMIVAGFMILQREASGVRFSPPMYSWICGILGSVVILFTFLRDTTATMGEGMPEPFSFGVYAVGIVFFLVAMFGGLWKGQKRGKDLG